MFEVLELFMPCVLYSRSSTICAFLKFLEIGTKCVSMELIPSSAWKWQFSHDGVESHYIIVLYLFNSSFNHHELQISKNVLLPI